MNEKSLNVFIDFGSSKIRLGAYNKATSKNIFISEKSCISNFNLKNFDITNSNEIIKELIKSAEKKAEQHIKNVNLMIDTPDMFSIDISIKKNSDSNRYSINDIKSLYLSNFSVLINLLLEPIIKTLLFLTVFAKKSVSCSFSIILDG